MYIGKNAGARFFLFFFTASVISAANFNYIVPLYYACKNKTNLKLSIFSYILPL